MSRKNVEWLYEELPALTRQGVLTPEAAEQLRAHYGPLDQASARRKALILFGAIGSGLIGLGIILLLAHNWEELSRPVRTALSLAPLLASQLLSAWVIVRRPASTAWREGAATFNFLMIGAAIALVAQTYNISGDPARFMLTWSLLGLPLVYLPGASLPAALYLAGITAWSVLELGYGDHPYFYWPLLALVVPHLALAIRRDRTGERAGFLGWAFCLALAVATGVVLEGNRSGLWIIAYASLFAMMTLAGAIWFGQANSFWRRPWHIAGGVGTVIFSLMLTYKGFWPPHHGQYGRYSITDLLSPGGIADLALTLVLFLAALALLIRVLTRGPRAMALYGVTPLVALAAYGARWFTADTTFPVILFNLFLLALAIQTIAAGLRAMRAGVVNAGMLILSILIIARFFDSGMPFTIRGLVFILLGAGFLAVNVILIRRRGGAQ